MMLVRHGYLSAIAFGASLAISGCAGTQAPPSTTSAPAARPLVARAQPAIPLWTNGAPGALGTADVDRPIITPYLPPVGTANGTAVVIFPGGGYQHLSMEKEGSDVANWLAGTGVTAFGGAFLTMASHGTDQLIVQRLMSSRSLKDAQRAIRIVRSRATEWNIDARRLGIIGFSAGGHLASTAGTHYDAGNTSSSDPIERVSSRPDFMLLLYPVITFRDTVLMHRGSRDNLIGKAPDPALVQLLSNETQVTRDTPPTFLVHSTDDRTVPVENSIMFYQALKAKGVPAEMHIFEYGGHGFGLAPSDPTLGAWTTLCEAWVRRHTKAAR